MSTAQDVALTIGKETSYGTPVTPIKSMEFLSESLNFRKSVNESASYRYGSRLASSAGRTIITSDAGGDVQFELGTKGFGLVLQACLGAVTNTEDENVYQQVHTIGDPIPSLTVQKVLPVLNTLDGSFADSVFTFDGSLVSKWTLEVPQAKPATLSLTLDCHDVKTTTPKAVPVYPVDSHLLHFGGACLFTGTLTPPTTTEPASALTPVANATSISIEVDNSLAADKSWYFCGGGKKGRPFRGTPKITGTIEVEYVANGPFVQAFLNDTAMTLLLNIRALENEDERVQIALKVPFTAYQSAAGGEPIYVVNRTYDITI